MQKQFESSRVATPAGGFNKRDAATYLGVSVRYLDMMVADGKLRRVRLGTKPLFRRVDLDELLERNLERESTK